MFKKTCFQSNPLKGFQGDIYLHARVKVWVIIKDHFPLQSLFSCLIHTQKLIQVPSNQPQPSENCWRVLNHHNSHLPPTTLNCQFATLNPNHVLLLTGCTLLEPLEMATSPDCNAHLTPPSQSRIASQHCKDDLHYKWKDPTNVRHTYALW